MDSKGKAVSSPFPYLSVVVPVFNESDSLDSVLTELKSVLSGAGQYTSEVIVVDDGSTDGTSSICAGHSAWVRLIRQETRHGVGASLKTGIAAARGERIAWIDGDGTYDPHSLLVLLHGLGKADQAVGMRSTDHGRLKWLRLVVKHASFFTASVLWGRWIPDLNSGLRVFRRESLLAWAHELPAGFSCASTATLAALKRRQRIVFIPIPYRARAAPSKFHPVVDTFRLWRVIFVQRFKRSVYGNKTV